MTADDPVVLLVEDERDLAELYAAWLEDHYDVRIAGGGQEALERVDDVDVVLLDRRLSDTTGDEVLVELRERGHDCMVAMLTALEPDGDVVALGFDDYLVKPVTGDQIRDLVERLLTRRTLDRKEREYFAVVSKIAALETHLPEEELAESEEYAALEDEAADLREEIDRELAALDDAGLRSILRRLDSGDASGA